VFEVLTPDIPEWENSGHDLQDPEEEQDSGSDQTVLLVQELGPIQLNFN